jgi:hypothetical protein
VKKPLAALNADGTNVRITWHGGATWNPAWWAPLAGASAL